MESPQGEDSAKYSEMGGTSTYSHEAYNAQDLSQVAGMHLA